MQYLKIGLPRGGFNSTPTVIASEKVKNLKKNFLALRRVILLDLPLIFKTFKKS